MLRGANIVLLYSWVLGKKCSTDLWSENDIVYFDMSDDLVCVGKKNKFEKEVEAKALM